MAGGAEPAQLGRRHVSRGEAPSRAVARVDAEGRRPGPVPAETRVGGSCSMHGLAPLDDSPAPSWLTARHGPFRGLVLLCQTARAPAKRHRKPFAAQVARRAQRQPSIRRARGSQQERNARLAKAHAPSRAAATPPSSPPQASVIPNAMLSLTAVPTAARAPARPFSRRPTHAMRFMCVERAARAPRAHATRAPSDERPI